MLTRAKYINFLIYEVFLEVGLTQLVCKPTLTTWNNKLDLILVSNTEIVGDVAKIAPLPKCRHCLCPVLVDLYIEVIYDSNNVNARLWNKGNYATINKKLEKTNWCIMFDVQPIDQYYGAYLK